MREISFPQAMVIHLHPVVRVGRGKRFQNVSVNNRSNLKRVNECEHQVAAGSLADNFALAAFLFCVGSDRFWRIPQ